MAKDSKSVAERAQELRDFSNKVSSVSDEDLEQVVGGIGGRPGGPDQSMNDIEAAIERWLQSRFGDDPR